MIRKQLVWHFAWMLFQIIIKFIYILLRVRTYRTRPECMVCCMVWYGLIFNIKVWYGMVRLHPYHGLKKVCKWVSNKYVKGFHFSHKHACLTCFGADFVSEPLCVVGTPPPQDIWEFYMRLTNNDIAEVEEGREGSRCAHWPHHTGILPSISAFLSSEFWKSILVLRFTNVGTLYQNPLRLGNVHEWWFGL